MTARALQQDGAPRLGWLRRRVLAVLVIGMLAAGLGLAFLTVAPNRLVTGTGVRLATVLGGAPLGWQLGLLLPAGFLLLAVVLPTEPNRTARAADAAVAVTAALLLAGVVALAGAEAARLSGGLEGSSPGSSIARVSFGGGFWALALLAWLAATDALQRLRLGWGARAVAHLAVLLAPLALLGGGALDQLSVLKEYANRHDVFQAAGLRHLQIMAATLLPALLLGLPLGVAAARHARFGRALLALLNVIQTMPAIALFALLIAPLGWLGEALPGWGLRGIGLLPAAVALTLYALLPIVHGMASGLRAVSPAVIEAATGMGLTPRQRFWQIELPLALPVLLSGLRVTTVQLVGLAVLAALIGAGGFGALVFQGLLSSALDLVLLGVVPVVALALAVDAGFALLTSVPPSALTPP